MAKDQITFSQSPLSHDMEQVKCMVFYVLRLGGLEPHKGRTVQLSDRPGQVYYGKHRDRFVQLPVCSMWGIGVLWVVMLTILTDPEQTRHGKLIHTVRKFKMSR